MKKIYKLASFGYGGMAGIHLDKVLCKYDRIDVKGVYDIDPARNQAAADKGFYAYSSKDELLNDPEIDIVLVATTNECHKDLCIESLRHGKHVLCEKPVTMNTADLDEIIAVAKETGLVFTVDQNRRVNKDFLAMKKAVESGKLGDVYVIESRVEGSRGLPAGWRADASKGGGMMLDWGVHLIDQLMYMYPQKITNVFCKMYSVNYPDVDDNFRLTMTFEHGLTAHIEVSTNNYIRHPRWYVLGSKGTLQIDDWDSVGKIVRPIDAQNSWGVDIVSTKAGPSKTMAPRDPSTVETIPVGAIEGGVPDDLTSVYNPLVKKLDGEGELTITPEQARRVIQVMEAAFESSKTGTAIQTNI